jgi:NADPH-dependent 2,4-dienoyl-CoA reductase/sulfur reductase-like enzyme/peroxiredoxin family protein/TusA-related sulfurtransferase/rhodanese-related sulfurtransferase
MKILVVGGVAAGASTAARLRRLNEEAEIIMFEKGEYISFANCGLPYHIGEVIKEREKLIVTKKELMENRFNIDVRNNSEVIAVDGESKTVTVKSLVRGEYVESFDYLVLAPGAKPIVPPIEGISDERIYTLRNIPDTDKIKAVVDSQSIKDAVVIGGGYIGVEMAENLRERGLKVTLVEAAPHILAPFDSDMVVIAEKELEEKGVDLVTNDGVKSFESLSNGLNVTLNSGTKIFGEIVILAIGVKPDTEFLKNSGIKLGSRGHILTNEYMETNLSGVYAGGDAVEVVDFVNGVSTAIPLAGPANKQGRIIANNILGGNTKYNGTQGTSVIKVFDITAASTGSTERALQKFGAPYKVIYVHPNDHASYYPGATPISLKLIFNEEGKILGAQALGYGGVEKRIDVIATTMRLNGTIYDLTELELSYAPPFSSAKDPVNFAGFVAENILTGKSEVVLPRDVDGRDKEKVVILDVREQIEVEVGKIEGAINISVNELRKKIGDLDKSKEYWICCAVGLRGYVAERMLKIHGYKAKNITGGYKSYSQQKFSPKPFNDFQNEGKAGIEKETDANKKPEEETEVIESNKETRISEIITLDACGLSCPGPLMKVRDSVNGLKVGDLLEVKASDPGFYEDIKAWCKRTHNELIDLNKEKGITTATIKRGNSSKIVEACTTSACEETKDNKTMVVFSGDLDKAIASFIIANGAASMGKKVTMFFTFWGLNILRRDQRVTTKKNLIEKAFGIMMPRGSKRLKLSKMNMMGMGSKMIRGVMKNKNISSLEDLIEEAIKNGVEIVACSMSMDVMGIKKEELIEGVKEGGVGYYLGEAEDSNVNLFI